MGGSRGTTRTPLDEDDVTYARRLVAQRCLYGVDRNPVAVDLAKMSLWLVTLAREHAFTFLDHALRSGDSLVGLSNRQIDAFHWDDKAPGFEAMRIRSQLSKVSELRGQIRDAGKALLTSSSATFGTRQKGRSPSSASTGTSS